MATPNPITVALFLLTELSSISVIASPTSPYRKLLFIPFTCLVLFQLLIIGIDGGAAVTTYAAAFRITCLLFVVFDYVVATDAPRDIRQIGDKTNFLNKTFLQRHIWAFKLVYGPRNIGWSHEERSHLPPRPQYKSRSAFIIARLKLWAVHLLLHDVQLTLIRMSPHFKVVPPVWDPLVFTNISALLWRIHLGVAILAIIFITLEIQIALIGILWVGLGISDFEEWPYAFGSLWDAYSVRTFWSKTWHQMFRRIFTVPTNVIAEAVGLPRHGKLQRYSKIFLVFMFSGIAHQVADSVQANDWVQPTIIYYFLAQAPMIMIEDAVIALGKRAGIRASWFTKTVGYAYVLAWLALIAPLWAATEVPAGHYNDRMEWSVVDGWLRGAQNYFS